GSPVDDDLGAQDLVRAVGNLVDHDIASAPVQHAAVGAVQVDQSLEGPLGRVDPFGVTRDDRGGEQAAEVVDDRRAVQRVRVDDVALAHIPVVHGLVGGKELRALNGDGDVHRL